MKGDFTRDTFRQPRHYTSVRMQQGRVQMDADWNENEDLHRHLERTETIDVVGGCGTPEAEHGFQITFAGGKFRIGAGRYYVDGILAENDAPVDFSAQTDFPGQVDPVASTQFFYLDVWEEHVTALEDTLIREVALNGPDTATRLRVVWQVRALNAGAATTCDAAFALVPGPTNATLRARAKTPDDTEACTVKPGSSYKRLENQLYRVEVHAPGTLAAATFKWSRDNATVVSGLQITAPRTLTVDSVGRDQLLSFASGQSVEITDRRRELLGLPGDFFRITRVEGSNLFLDIAGPVVNPVSYGDGMKVRRWDSDGAIHFANLDPDGYMYLEDGVQVLLAGTDFRTGDYWLIPARTVTGDVEWPRTGAVPDARPPHGIAHHHCALALATKVAGGWSISDCRKPFVPLTKVLAMYYLAGDGQTVTPDPLSPGAFLALDTKPTVGVSRGKVPVAGARVRFTMAPAAGQIVGASVITTGVDGLATCDWRLGSTTPTQKLVAELLDSTNLPTHLPVTCTATLNTAAKVAYTPGCPDLAGKVTVQDALDELCKHRGAATCCKSVGEGGDYPDVRAALEDLLRRDIPGFCLCFLPGTHAWPNDVQFAGQNDKPMAVTLDGVRGASRIEAEGGLQFTKLTVLVVSDLILTVPKGMIFSEIEEVDVSFVRLQLSGDLLATRTGLLNLRDSTLRIRSGGLQLVGNRTLDLRNLFLTIDGDGDAVLVDHARSLALENCFLLSSSGRAASASIRLARIADAQIARNWVRAVRTNFVAGGPGGGIFTGNLALGGIARDMLAAGRTGPGQALTTFAGRIASRPPADRAAMAKEIDTALTGNFLAMRPEERTALRDVRGLLAAATPSAAAIGEALGSLAAAGGGPEPLGTALVLQDGAGTYHVSDSVFQGVVGLYGDPGSRRITPGQARALDERMKAGGPPWGDGSLHFSNNELIWLLLAEPFTDPGGPVFKELIEKGSVSVSVFRNGHVSGNTLAELPVEMLFGMAALSGNVMTAPANNEFGGVVVAQRATYTGNINTGGGVTIVSAATADAQAANVAVSFS